MRRTRYDFFDEDFLPRLERLHLAGKHLATRERHGVRRARRIGDGLEFADHRAYAPGDDVRFIDWAYYARMEKLLLRLFHEHSESDVGVLLDVSGSMGTGGSMEKFDYARRCAAALAYVAMGGFERVVVAPFAEDLGAVLRTGRNRAQIFDVLDSLGGLSPGGRTHFGPCLGQFAQRYPEVGTVLILSDLLDCEADLSAGLGRLRLTGCDVTAIHLYGPTDADPRVAGPVVLEQSESGRRCSLDVTEEVLRSYRERWREFCGACERTCLGRGVPYVGVSTDMAFERLVLFALRQAGVLTG
ncbi:MAG TPA: DUF58 domain-containing protein [Phycisphaerae bacterium]|nr:DUF58 domain-containing protein [Phycisphaerae bacterium]